MELNFNKLLEPYREGGTKESPVIRTLETITSKLITAHKFPPDIVGAALLKVFYEMANNGLIFKGNGSYGSKGAELFSCIKAQCIDTTARKATQEVRNQITEKLICCRADCRKRTNTFKALSKWNRFMKFMLKPRGLWRL